MRVRGDILIEAWVDLDLNSTAQNTTLVEEVVATPGEQCWLRQPYAERAVCLGGMGVGCECVPGFEPLPPELQKHDIDGMVLEACAKCGAGQFKGDYGFHACQTCGPGTFASALGSSYCSLCQPGKFASEWGAAECTQCPPFGAAEGWGAEACVCVPGAVTTTDGRCIPCSAGWKSVDPMTCQACAVGSFSDAEGSTLCLACSKGAYASAEGSTVCVECATGASNGVRCVCEPGSFALEDGQCAQCAEGQYSSMAGVLAACAECAAGTYTSARGATTCGLCHAGSFASAVGSTACDACRPFSSSPPSASACACVVGAVASADGRCLPCSVGWRWLDVETCQACAAGSFSDAEGSTSCLACSKGSYASAEGSTACVECVTGESNGVRCVCEPGSFALEDGQCAQCAEGQYSSMAGVLAACVECVAGTYTSARGSTGCAVCHAGTFASSLGSTACDECMPHSNSPPSATACACVVGAVNALDGRCLPCSAGWRWISAQACIPCAAGSFASAMSSTACTECGAGTYAPDAQATACAVCEAGSFASDAASTKCDICGEGLISVPLDLPTACVPPPNCAAGERFVYQNGGCQRCRSCPIGQYEAAACELLGADTACTPCTLCKGETWKRCGLTRDTVCLDDACNEGFVVSAERPECIPCPPGTFASARLAFVSVSVCRRCEGGTIAPDWASSACVSCGAYDYASANRTVCVAECGAGAMLSADGDCEPCPPGTAGVGCAPCAPDTFAAFSGLAECVPCVPPLYALAGSSACTEPLCVR